MISSPCAMLMTPITPKVMARPTAASSSTEPSDRPNQTFCACVPHRLACARSPPTASAPPPAISGSSALAAAASAAAARRGRRARRRRRSPRPWSASGASLASTAAAARLRQRLATAGVGLGGERGVERRELLGIGVREGLGRGRRGAAPGRGRISVSVDDRRADRAAQRVVDLDRLGRARRRPARARRRSAGRSPAPSTPRPVTRTIAPSALRACSSPSPSASSTAAARSSPVAPMAATTSARSPKLPSGSCAISSSSVCAAAAAAGERPSQTRIRAMRRMAAPREGKARGPSAPRAGRRVSWWRRRTRRSRR